MNRLLTAFFLCISVTVCSPGRDNPSHSFELSEESGVTIATNSGGPKYSGELFEYEKVLELREDEREESILFRPGGFLMDEEGYFYVSDVGNRRVAVFDPEGRYSHQLGREGQGPGELQYVEIQYVRNGIVSVYDLRQRRVSRFHTDGTLYDTTPLPQGTERDVTRFIHVPGDREVLIRMDTPYEGDRSEYERVHATIYDIDGDTIWTSDFDWVRTRFMGVMKISGYEFEQPFWYQYASRPVCIYEPVWGVVYTSGWEPELDVYDLRGRRRRRIRIVEDPEPVSRNDMYSVQQYMDRMIEQLSGTDREMWQSERDNCRAQEYKAFWSAVDVDDSGYIWLQYATHHYALEDSSAPGLRYRILSPEGEYLGNTVRPRGNHFHLSNGHLLVTRIDREKGEYVLTAYRIHSAVDGLRYPR